MSHEIKEEITNTTYIAEHLNKNGVWLRLEDTFAFGEIINSIGVAGTQNEVSALKTPIEKVLYLLKSKNRHSDKFRIVKLETHKIPIMYLNKDW